MPKLLPLATLQKVLQNLLAEGVHIRDMRTILETLAEHAPRTQDADELTAAVRVALSRAILQQVFGSTRELEVVHSRPAARADADRRRAPTRGAEGPGLEPGLAERLMRQAGAVRAGSASSSASRRCCWCRRLLRNLLARFLRRAAPQLKVLSQAEIPDNRTVKVVDGAGRGGGARMIGEPRS